MNQPQFLKKRYYFLAYFLTIAIALLLLLLSCFLPQAQILGNIENSIGGLRSEGLHPFTFDQQDASALDTYSDVEMLRGCASLSKDNIDAILTNDQYYDPTSENILEDLASYVSRGGDACTHYVRYWMGFRATLRLLLVFLNYFQIRRYLGAVFFCILFALVFHIEKHADKYLAYLFALSVILVRPNIIVSSLQFSCCFFIAFGAMFFVPFLYRSPKWQRLFFMEIGMITMYFDFYTVPLITFGYPLVYLLALQAGNQDALSGKEIGKLLMYWLIGWAMMWIAKLTLTTLLTDVNGIQNGFQSFFGRVGIVKNQDLLKYYSIPYAFRQLAVTVFSDLKGAIVYVGAVAICALFVAVYAVRNKVPAAAFGKHWPFLIVAVIPVVWFVITAQPIAIHAFFQYRSIAIIYWSIFSYLHAALSHADHLRLAP